MWWAWILPLIPQRMMYCGMEVTLTPQAQQIIQNQVIQLYEHPATLQKIVQRAESLMIYIEEALLYVGVPEDLKYIALQESRLDPHAVSRSMAVGYWQLKDYTAREVGVWVDEVVDERKHIFRASVGAALYFHRQYQRHKNWLSAIISYYEGGTGAIPYIDPRYVGLPFAEITEKTHWYALRALAYKIAYEPLLQKKVIPMRPYLAQGSVPISEIAQKHQLSVEDFRRYNPWILGKTLPAGRVWSYYVPHGDTVFFGDPSKYLTPQPVKRYLHFAKPIFSVWMDSLIRNLQVPVVDTVAVPATIPAPFAKPSPKRTHVVLSLQREPTLNLHWVYVHSMEAATSYAPLRKLHQWNPYFSAPGPVLVVPPRRAEVHIAQGKETLKEIGKLYRVAWERLEAYNRVGSDSVLPRGYKVYLRAPRRVDEYPIIYRW
ncbi:MAG: transglycosylase SLT domain-containing protein [Bacteroidia bacterium]